MTSTTMKDPVDWARTPPAAALAFARCLAVVPGTWLTAPAAAAAAGLDLAGAGLNLAVLTAVGTVTARAARYQVSDAAALKPSDSADTAVAGLTHWYLRSARAALTALGMVEGYWPLSEQPPGTGQALAPASFPDHVTAYAWLLEEEENLLAVLDAANAAKLSALTWQLAVVLLETWSFRGVYDRWQHTARIALNAAALAADPVGHAQALAYEARGLSEQGMLDQAEMLQRHALAIREYAQDGHGLAQSYDALGLIMQRRGDRVTAIAHYRACEKIALECGYHLFVAIARHNLGDVLRTEGRLEEAGTHLELALDYFREHGHLQQAASAVQILADISGLEESIVDGLEEAQQALAQSALVPNRSVLAWALRTMAVALTRSGRAPEAIEAARTAAALFASLSDSQRHADTLELAAELYDGQAEHGQAEVLRAKAAELRAQLYEAEQAMQLEDTETLLRTGGPL